MGPGLLFLCPRGGAERGLTQSGPDGKGAALSDQGEAGLTVTSEGTLSTRSLLADRPQYPQEGGTLSLGPRVLTSQAVVKHIGCCLQL